MPRAIMSVDIHIRPAIQEELAALTSLINASVRQLQSHDYTIEQIEGALQTVFGVDTQLITDGTYLVAEARSPQTPPIIVACGGWSKRKTLFGSDHWSARQDDLLDPRKDAAKIRAFFIHPDWARRGIGTRLLQACEDAARAAGFTRFEMGATLTGAKLFAAKGYLPLEYLSIPLLNGASLPIIHMHKHANK
jgi:GNAT superfamily N-acetyltransferase